MSHNTNINNNSRDQTINIPTYHQINKELITDKYKSPNNKTDDEYKINDNSEFI